MVSRSVHDGCDEFPELILSQHAIFGLGYLFELRGLVLMPPLSSHIACDAMRGFVLRIFTFCAGQNSGSPRCRTLFGVSPKANALNLMVGGLPPPPYLLAKRFVGCGAVGYGSYHRTHHLFEIWFPHVRHCCSRGRKPLAELTGVPAPEMRINIYRNEMCRYVSTALHLATR